jgi:hypothetical protein
MASQMSTATKERGSKENKTATDMLVKFVLGYIK